MPTGGFSGYAPSVRTSGNANANSIFLTALVAQRNGLVTAVLLDTPSATASTTFKALIYDSAHSVLLASSAQITSIGAGYNRIPLANLLSVTAGTTYYVGYACSTSLPISVSASTGPISWWANGGQSVTTPANPLATGSSSVASLMIALELDGTDTSGYGFSADQAIGVTLSSFNTVATCPAGTANSGARSLVTKVSGTGKWYAEILVGGTLAGLPGIGVGSANVGITQGPTAGLAYAVYLLSSGTTSNGVALGLSYVSGDIIGIAYDAVNNLLWWNKNNGSWFGASSTAGNPAAGTGGSALTATAWPMTLVASTGAAAATVFTLRDRAGALQYTPPSGFSSWSAATTIPNAVLGGVTRESLLSSDGIVYLGGVAREALISGLGLDGQGAAARSSAQAQLAITQNFGGNQAHAKSFLQAQLTITGGVSGVAGGAGGGGAAGLFGAGEFGQGGQYDGTGGYGGAGDLFHTPRQTTPSTTGNTGTEYDGTRGSGSGGSGGSWGGSGHGGNGGVGGLYGGGGGGGGAGLAGGGLGALGGEGVIYLEYDPGTGPVVILLTHSSTSPFTFPPDWNTSNNTVLIVGAGGCGHNGGLSTGGDGGGGGSVVGAVNTALFTPGQVLAFSIPSAAQVCAGTGGNTNLGIYSAPPGINGDGTTGGTPIVPIPPVSGGIGAGGGGTGGGGGPGGGGPGGGVATLIDGRIETKSRLQVDANVQLLPPRQYAVSVQTWHW